MLVYFEEHEFVSIFPWDISSLISQGLTSYPEKVGNY